MAQSALRNLPLERMNARRERAGMEPVTQEQLASMLGGNPFSQFTSLNTPENMSLGATATDVAMGFLPFVGTAQGVRDFERARRDDDTLGMILGGLSAVPVAGGLVKAGRAAEGALDMSQAARMQRADEMGYMPETYYHASTSDIDEFRPKYDDGLTFITPNPEFANRWLGKGGSRSKLMQASLDSPLYKQYKAEREGIRGKYAAKYGDDIDQWPESERDKYWQESRNLTRQYDATDQVIYPLRTNVQNTFDPQEHEDVIVEFLKSKGRDPTASTLMRDKTDLEMYKTGNYLLFETPEMVQFLKNKGFDSMRLAEDAYNNGVFDTLAVFDPANIRSVNAAFDPAKLNSANLAAGIMGGAVGLSALRNIAAQREQE